MKNELNILLKLHRNKEEEQVAEHLKSRFQIVRSDQYDPSRIDLCIFDRHSWESQKGQVRELREVQDPLSVPVMLLVGDVYIKYLSDETLELVDEILTKPIKTDLLDLRLRNLRRIRNDSLRLNDQKNQMQQFREAMDAAYSGLILTDNQKPDNPIVYANEAFEEITGYSAEEIVCKNCRFLQGGDRDQNGLDKIRNSIENGESCEVILRNYTKQGTMFWNELKISPIRNGRGDITHFIGVQHDITDRVEDRRQIEESNKQWQALVGSMPDSVLITTGEEGRIEYVNQAGASIYGVEDPEELVGHTLKELLHESPDLKIVEENLRMALAGEEIPVQTLSIRDVKNELRHLEINAVPIQYEDQPGVLTLSRDVTEKHRLQKELEREYNKLSQLFANDPSGLALCDPKGNIQSVNDTFECMFGYQEEEIVGKNLDRLLTLSEEEQKDAEELTKLHREGAPQETRIRYDKEGNPLHVLVAGAPIREEGELTQFYAIYVDITEQKQLEKENKKLLEQEKRLRAQAEESMEHFKDMFDAAPSAICLLEGPEHRFTYVNQAYRDMFKKKEFIGHTVSEVFPEIADQGFNDLLDSVYENGDTYQAKEQSIWVWDEWDEEWFYKVMNFVYEPLMNDNGESYGIYVEVIDVTDVVNYREELQDRLKEKETLLEEIHHRVKNNLAVISGLLYMQAEEAEDEKVRHSLEDSLGRIKSMALVHEELYKYSEDESVIHMDNYLPRLVETIEQSHGREAGDIEMNVDSDPIELSLPVSVPVGLITSELLINAYKHAFDGRDTGHIRVQLKKQDPGMVLSVEDDGIGLPENFSLDSTSLGMQVIQNLATQIGAEITFDSERGEGTKFKVSIARQEEEK